MELNDALATVEGFAETAPVELYGLGQAWYSLSVFIIISLAVGIDISIVTLLVHPIETALRINDVGFAAITAIPTAIGLVAVYYPAGLLADTFRRRDIIAAGAVIWGLAALIAARADSGAMLFIARLLAGIGTGLPIPAILSMITDTFPRTRRAFAIGIYNAGISIGVGVGLTICSALVAATQRTGTLRLRGLLLLPWQQCFVAVAMMGIIVLMLVLTVPEPPRRERSTLANANLTSSLCMLGRYLRRYGLLWVLLLLGFGLFQVSYFSITAWAPAFGMRHYGATGVSSIALLGTFSAGGTLLGSIVGGLLAQRSVNHDPRVVPRMLVAGAVISCVSAAGFPFMPSWLLAVVGIGFVSATLMFVTLLVQSGIQETAPNEVRGQLFGLWGFVGCIPLIAGPTLVAFLASGIFAKAGGLGPAMAVVCGITSVLAGLLFAFSGTSYTRAKYEFRAL